MKRTHNHEDLLLKAHGSLNISVEDQVAALETLAELPEMAPHLQFLLNCSRTECGQHVVGYRGVTPYFVETIVFSYPNLGGRLGQLINRSVTYDDGGCPNDCSDYEWSLISRAEMVNFKVCSTRV